MHVLLLMILYIDKLLNLNVKFVAR